MQFSMVGMVVGGRNRAAYQPDDDVTFVSTLSTIQPGSGFHSISGGVHVSE